MKRIITAVLALLIVTSCNGQDVKTHGRASQANNLKSQNMSKSIVIFFSHAGDNYSVGNIEVGNTKIVADYICRLTKAPPPTSDSMTPSSSAVLCGGAPIRR